MKVLLINGSPHEKGCTYTALSLIAGELNAAGIETEILNVGTKPVGGCIGCGGCAAGKGCVFGGVVNEAIEKAKTADAFVFGTPVHYASASGNMLAAHQASGADVTVAYQKTEIPEGRKNDNYTLTVDADGRVTELLFNDYRPGVQNLDLNIYVLERETLLKLVRDATSRGLIYFERDILAHNVNILNIHALEYTGYVAHVCDMKSYFDENLKLTDDENLEKLFPKKSPVYTKIRDDNPTRYVPGCKVTDSILADGCVIEGTVENCVLFRGVKVKKGAVVKNYRPADPGTGRRTGGPDGNAEEKRHHPCGNADQAR